MTLLDRVTCRLPEWLVQHVRRDRHQTLSVEAVLGCEAFPLAATTALTTKCQSSIRCTCVSHKLELKL
jgi:hypothetical protein